jgi:hypothetical protein
MTKFHLACLLYKPPIQGKYTNNYFEFRRLRRRVATSPPAEMAPQQNEETVLKTEIENSINKNTESGEGHEGKLSEGDIKKVAGDVIKCMFDKLFKS